MTELTFLVDLLLNHKLAKATKDKVAERIREVEASFGPKAYQVDPVHPAAGVPIPPQLARQAPSTIAAMMRHPDLIDHMGPPVSTPTSAPAVPVEQIAQTPAAAAALASREASIAAALSGKPEKGRTSPRKF